MTPQPIHHADTIAMLTATMTLFIALPALAAGVVLMLWGARFTKGLMAAAAGLACAGVGAVAGTMAWRALDPATEVPMVGAGAGAALGCAVGVVLTFVLFRAVVAVCSGVGAALATLMVGMLLIVSMDRGTPTGSSASGASSAPSAPTADASPVLQETQADQGSSEPRDTAAGAHAGANEPRALTSLAQEALEKAQHAKEGAQAGLAGGPRASVRDIARKNNPRGRNPLQAERTRDESGRTRLTITDKEWGELPDEASQAASVPAPSASAVVPDTLREMLAAAKQRTPTQESQTTNGTPSAAQSSALLDAVRAGDSGTMLSTARDMGSRAASVLTPTQRGLALASLGVAMLAGLAGLGLAAWKPRHAQLAISSVLGATLLVVGVQLLAAGVLPASLGGPLTGALASFTIWAGGLTLGCWFQSSRNRVWLMAQDASPAQTGARDAQRPGPMRRAA